MADAFGEALLDHYRGERNAPLRQRDGDAVKTHPVGDFYFGDFADEPGAAWIDSRVEGPLLDLGAGSGRDALYFQDYCETVAVEISDALVRLLSERGVEHPQKGDMFECRTAFERDRFRTVLILGTQLGLARSTQGLRGLLGDLAWITDSAATLIVDGYDPTYEGAPSMLGFRSDPTPGLAFRVLRYEYGDLVGDILLSRLWSPDRLREAAAGTGWSVSAIQRPHDAYYYRAALTKA